MLILAVSDLHGALGRIQQLAEHLERRKERPDWLICCGDLTNFGQTGDLRRTAEGLARLAPRAAAVLGNCDPAGGAPVLEEAGTSLEDQVLLQEEWALAGMGGALPGPGATPNEISEADIRSRVIQVCRENTESLRNRPWVWVSHQPPYGTAADRAMRMKHVGSHVLRSWIDGTLPGAGEPPWLVLTGHIHESPGSEKYGNTWVVNPGPLSRGRFALVEAGNPGEDPEIRLERIGGRSRREEEAGA